MKRIERISYRISEVAAATGASDSLIRDLIQAGELQCVRVRKSVFVPASEVERLFNLPSEAGGLGASTEARAMFERISKREAG